MLQRVAASVTLTAMLLIPLFETNHTIAAVDSTAEPKAAPGGTRSARESVRLAIPYLERAGQAWIKKRQCVSCHQVPFMLWSLSAADRQGYPVNRARLKEQLAWSTKIRSFVKPDQKDDLDKAETLAANIDTLNALLLGPADHVQPETAVERSEPAWRQRFVSALQTNQLEQGNWKPCGQLPAQKRPLQETTQVTTAWTILALNRNNALAERNQQALETLQNETPVSTEWWVVRLLLADEETGVEADAYCDALIKKQQADGGWGWLTTESSDALATGMAIYALSRHSNDNRERSILKAVTFLTESQTSDGSWQVPGTKKTARNKPTPTSNYWGTAWAVIGLLESENRYSHIVPGTENSSPTDQKNKPDA